MMAEIEEELARKAALEAFQKKLAEEKAAAAASTAAYQARLHTRCRFQELMEAQLALEQRELTAFEAQLAAEADTARRELTEFEAQLEEELANQDCTCKIPSKTC